MRPLFRFSIRFTLVLFLANIAVAQTKPVNDLGSGLTITAFATGDHVRFAAPSSVVQIRLEVYNSTGKKLFDIEVRGGNVLDWHLQDGQAEALTDDAYLCVITVKSLSGKLTQRIGSVNIEKLSASVQPIDASQITSQQSQAIGPVEENASLTVLKEDDNNTTAIIAHDGQDGQITRGRGALSFRIGDFFSGKDSEQMRLTAEGNLGIGIAHPQARLDVDGLIRTTQGIIFPDGSIQTTAAIADGSQQTPGVKLPGQQGSVNQAPSKAGKVGKGQKQVSPEFNVNEDLTVNGNIIFTPSLSRDITVQNNNGGIRIFANPVLTGSPATAAIQFFGNGHPGFPGQAYIDSGAHDQAAVIFRTAVTGGTIAERMRITAAGNIGIGTATPGERLHVAQSGDYQLRLENPAAGGGSWNIGQSDNTFNISGGKLAFVPNSTNSSNATVVFTNAGNVGIGTTSPAHRLSLIGGPAWTSNGWAGALSLTNASAIGWHSNADGQRFGIGQSTGGLYFFRTSSDPGTTGSPANYDMLITDGGRVGVGNVSPSARLQADGGTAVNVGVAGTSSSPGGVGVVAVGYFGVVGQADESVSQGREVLGRGGVAGVSQGGTGVIAVTVTGNLMAGITVTDPSNNTFAQKFHIDKNGTYFTGSDFAESLPARGNRAAYEPGDVLVLSATAAGKAEKSIRPYDTHVAGVYSTRPGVVGADKNGETRVDPDELPVALIGIVPTKVSAENGPILVGDLLTTSRTPGYAMKATPVIIRGMKVYRTGTILGKALGPLKQGKGVIKVLVTLR